MTMPVPCNQEDGGAVSWFGCGHFPLLLASPANNAHARHDVGQPAGLGGGKT